MLPEKNVLQENQTSTLKKNKANRYLYLTGIVLLTMSVLLGAKIFYPVAREEMKYQVLKNNLNSDKTEKANSEKENIPIDEEFGILIPKIGANAKIISDVDAQNSAVYQRALTKGVAHAKGTAKPGEKGNIFIFAHSSADILEANKYNAVFYLLSKLENGDDVFIYYNKQKHHYIVSEKKTVNSDEIKYMEKTSEEQLTLMTCWPPGTTLKRLLIVANKIEE